MLGQHQTANFGVALAALVLLRQTDSRVGLSHLRSGVRDVHWPARFQVIPGRPTMIFDVAHNASGMQVFGETWPRVFGGRRAVTLFTTRDDKNYRVMWTSLAPAVSVWVGCPLPHSPGIGRATMEDLARKAGIPFEWYETPIAGYRRARALAGPDGLCLVAGSHYLVGDVIPAAWVAIQPLVKSPIQQLTWDDILASLKMPS